MKDASTSFRELRNKEPVIGVRELGKGFRELGKGFRGLGKGGGVVSGAWVGSVQKRSFSLSDRRAFCFSLSSREKLIWREMHSNLASTPEAKPAAAFSMLDKTLATREAGSKRRHAGRPDQGCWVVGVSASYAR